MKHIVAGGILLRFPAQDAGSDTHTVDLNEEQEALAQQAWELGYVVTADLSVIEDAEKSAEQNHAALQEFRESAYAKKKAAAAKENQGKRPDFTLLKIAGQSK